MQERIYRLERLIEPGPIAGQSRIATVDDRAVLYDFVTAFMREALDRHDDDYAREIVDRGLDLGQRTFYLWDDGGVVSLAATGGTTPNGIRLGPVYTPPALRGRGYGSAVTAAASRAELDAGRRFIFLFTDLANPTSNKIYQSIGYEPVTDIDQLVFEAS
jgi:predicted GNAT family acetyltransferase